MTEPDPPQMPRRQNQLEKEAAHWFARMRGPNADKHRPDFERWLALGAAHLGAYNRASELWSMGNFLANEPLIAGEGGSYPAPSPLQEPPHPAPRKRGRGVVMCLLAGCLSVFLVSGWFLSSSNQQPGKAGQIGTVASSSENGSRSERIEFATIAGETRTVRLDDGSMVTLSPGSRLTVLFNLSERHLRLERGRGRFDVAHEKRPFIVSAGLGTVTAHGTIFDVELSGTQRISVKLIRGSIAVEMPSSDESAEAKASVRWLVPGEQVEFANATLPTPAVVPVPAALAGAALEFDDVRLADLVARTNRGSVVKLRIDPSLADLRISGRFQTADKRKLADAIASTFNLKVDADPPGVIRLSKM